MMEPKISRVLVLTPEDMCLIGGKAGSYGSHSRILFDQLHKCHTETGNIFLCTLVSGQGYHRHLNGRRPQPEWLYEYFGEVQKSLLRGMAEFQIAASIPPQSNSEAVEIMTRLVTESKVKPTFYLPITEEKNKEQKITFWEERLRDILPLLRGELALNELPQQTRPLYETLLQDVQSLMTLLKGGARPSLLALLLREMPRGADTMLKLITTDYERVMADRECALALLQAEFEQDYGNPPALTLLLSIDASRHKAEELAGYVLDVLLQSRTKVSQEETLVIQRHIR